MDTKTTRSSIDPAKLLVGAGLVLLGLWLALDQLDDFHLHLRPFWHLWPLLLVAIGVMRLAGGGGRREQVGGWWLVAIGLWLYLSLAQSLGFRFDTSWPLLVITVGLLRFAYPRRGESRLHSLWLLGAGVLLLLVTRQVFGLTFYSAWPILIVLAGACLVWGALFPPVLPAARDASEKSDATS